MTFEQRRDAVRKSRKLAGMTYHERAAANHDQLQRMIDALRSRPRAVVPGRLRIDW